MKRADIERLLPGVFQRTLHPGNPLVALLEVMEALQQPAEAALARLDATLDPRRSSDEFVPFLARWLDLERLFEEPPVGKVGPASSRPISTGLGRLREVIASAAYLAQWRGTARGLRRFLETATGSHGFEIHEQVTGPDGAPKPFHILVRAPEATARHRSLLERIIESEKPAHVTYELAFAQIGQGGV